MVAGTERSLPKPKEQESVGPHVGFTDAHYLSTKKELLNWLDKTEKRFQVKSSTSHDALTIRASLRMAEASAKLRHQLNPAKDEKLLAEPVDLWARLTEIVNEIIAEEEARTEVMQQEFDDAPDIEEEG